MSSCSAFDRPQSVQGSPLSPAGLHKLLSSITRIRKTCQHVSDIVNIPWLSSESWRPPVAISTEDPVLPSFDHKILTRAAHFCLSTFGIDEDCLDFAKRVPPASTPIWESDSLHFPSKPTSLLRSLHNFLKPYPHSSLFSIKFTLRALRWCCGLLMTENSCSPDSLVYVRSDKYLEKRSGRGNPSGNISFVEASSPSNWRRENANKSVLGLNYPFQVLNPSSQADLSSPLCVLFVEESREQPSIRRPFTGSAAAHDILLGDGVKECDGMTRNYLSKSDGSSDPEDNAGWNKRVEDSSSRAPADGETSKKPSKSQRPNSHYDEGTNGTAKTDKKRKRDSPERDDDDFDDSGRGGGRPNSGKRRKDEEEESEKNKFACPFYKNDPQAFRASRTCVGPGWSSVHRVKEHIFRRHMLSDTQCHDCMEDFETHVALDEHLETPCRLKPPLKPHGINKKQEGQLRSRKMYQKSLDEEEKWRAIYKIIFPDAQGIPSPYYEPEVPEFPDYYRQMFLRKLPGNVTEQLIAPGSELMKHITTNAVANQQISTRDAGRKLSGGYTLPSSTQVLAKEQLVQQIQNAVEAAVRKTLSQVDAPKQSNSEPPDSNPEF
ncbi:hypothetical protein FALCPG4_005855 [Fusarium falciforme]